MSPTVRRSAPRAGALGGAVACAVIAVSTAALDAPSAVPALLLVVVVVGATVIGGRLGGFVTAAIATVALRIGPHPADVTVPPTPPPRG